MLGAKRSRRTRGFYAKSDDVACYNSRPIAGEEHVSKARQLLSHWDFGALMEEYLPTIIAANPY